MRWLNPQYLILLLAAGWIAWRIARNRRLRATVRFPDTAILARVPRSWAERLARLPHALPLVALAVLILAMARPQMGEVQRKVSSYGVDIALILDVSGSMRAQDFDPDRLGAAKNVVKSFIENRKGDQFSLIVFATTAVTLCPTTLDSHVVAQFVDRVHHGIVNDERTAIGMGLATALKSFEGSKAKSKIVILLTDGQNNTGTISPLQAAEAAKALGVRVYTIGVGTRGVAMVPAQDQLGRTVLQPMQVDIDEDTLQQIARMTGGQYYRATDTKALGDIYNEIDRLEKSDIEFVEHDRFDERADWLLLPALALLLIELGLRATRLGGLP